MTESFQKFSSVASAVDSASALRALLDEGLDVNCKLDFMGWSLLHLFCSFEKVSNDECVRLLLDRNALVNVKDINGWTPLHKAAMADRVEAARMLVDSGAAREAEDKNDHFAFDFAKSQALKTLLEVQLPWWKGQLLAAAAKNDADALQSILDSGGDANEMAKGTDRPRERPLHLAAQSGNIECIEVLLANGADVNARNKFGGTALMDAAEGGEFDCTKLLLDKGADMNAVKDGGATALHLASENADTELVKLLLERGADVNFADTYGNTPLHNAARRGRLEVAALLLEHGANVSVNAANISGGTPLHYAMQSDGGGVCAMLLLKHGADKEARDQSGKTPSDYV